MEEIYTSDEYGNRHEDWHLGDAEAKASELLRYFSSIVKKEAKASYRVADIGGGAGGVSFRLLNSLRQEFPQIIFEFHVFEISQRAIALGKEKHPDLVYFNEFFDPTKAKYDIVMYIDVLEHVENQWAMLSNMKSSARYIIVRQPLLENFSTFRSKNYKHQRESWGHINFFTYYSFIDLLEYGGFTPFDIELLPPWKLLTDERNIKYSQINYLVHRMFPIHASYFMSGYYLNGAFELKK